MLVYGKMLLYLRTTKHLYMNQNNLHINLMCATGRMSLYTYVPLYIRHRDDPSGLSDCIYVFLRDTRLWTQAFFRVYLIEYLSFVSVGAGFACPKTFR